MRKITKMQIKIDSKPKINSIYQFDYLVAVNLIFFFIINDPLFIYFH